ISQLFDELEFRTLKRRVLGEDDLAPEFKAKSTQTKGNQNQLNIFGSPPATDVAPFAPTEGTSDHSGNNGVKEEAYESAVEFKPKKTIANTLHHYHIVDTQETRQSLAKYLALQNAFCFDTETTSVNALDA